MSGLIRTAKSSVGTFNEGLGSLVSSALSVDSGVCSLEDTISALRSSTDTQEDKISALDTFAEETEEFVDEVVRIDGEAADAINSSKDDFYDDYYYLKPESEKTEWEKFKDACGSVKEWVKDNWKKIVIGIVVIAVGAVLTALTGGTFLAAFLVGLKAAAISGLIGGAISAGISLIGSLIRGESFGTTMGHMLRSFVDGFASGFMWGGIFAGASQGMAAIMRFSKTGTLTFMGGKNLQVFNSTSSYNYQLGSRIKFWSPNSVGNPNSGGTFLKFGNTFRLDFEAGKQLFHTHITTNMYNKLPGFIKGMKFIFDPARRDVHVRLTSLLGGLFGAADEQ
ncbi:hypothetical protein [uncultured Ruminococcus sp.]|uniref:hypothetical protein n=1 Tax=uncultured Ruminococcus sp. TaxID=165186 RepID=UPI002603B35D|nr:hypothetical protein [uncultured Ruminococcus sp.]